MQLKDILKEKRTAREVHQGGLALARQYPGSPGTCNPEETGLPGLPMYWSPTLFSGSGPVGLPPVPWTEKQLKGRHFSSDAEVIPDAETWLHRQRSEFFFEWLAKVRAVDQEVYWASWGVCWINLEFVRCSFFLPSRAKDLSATPRIILQVCGMAAPVTLPAVQTNTTLKFCVIIDLKKAAHFLNFFKKYQTSTRLALLLVDINKKTADRRNQQFHFLL